MTDHKQELPGTMDAAFAAEIEGRNYSDRAIENARGWFCTGWYASRRSPPAAPQERLQSPGVREAANSLHRLIWERIWWVFEKAAPDNNRVGVQGVVQEIYHAVEAALKVPAVQPVQEPVRCPGCGHPVWDAAPQQAGAELRERIRDAIEDTFADRMLDCWPDFEMEADAVMKVLAAPAPQQEKP